MHHSEIICIYVARELNIDDINDDEALKQLFYIVKHDAQFVVL